MIHNQYNIRTFYYKLAFCASELVCCAHVIYIFFLQCHVWGSVPPKVNTTFHTSSKFASVEKAVAFCSRVECCGGDKGEQLDVRSIKNDVGTSVTSHQILDHLFSPPANVEPVDICATGILKYWPHFTGWNLSDWVVVLNWSRLLCREQYWPCYLIPPFRLHCFPFGSKEGAKLD